MKCKYILLISMILFLFSCYENKINNKEKSLKEVINSLLGEIENNKIRIFYLKEDQNYDKFNMILEDNNNNLTNIIPSGAIFYNNKEIVYFIINVTEKYEKFIYHFSDDNTKRIIDIKTNYREFFSYSDDNNVYTLDNISSILKRVIVQNKDNITLFFKNFDKNDITKIIIKKRELNLDFKVLYSSFENDITKLTLALINNNEFINDLKVYFNYKEVEMEYSQKYIDKEFNYDGDLGAIYKDNKVNFKLWAPLAEDIILIIYDKNDSSKSILERHMQKLDKGLWYTTLSNRDIADDPNGYFYQYRVINPHFTKLVLDPYAKSMAIFNNSTDKVGKGAIINPSKTGKVDSFANFKDYKIKDNSDVIIYEVHVRDFTSHPILEGTLEHRFGTFKSFIEKLDYIKNLGITHIQLLPVMAYYSGDESEYDKKELNYSALNNNYNWGYDPQNYFSLDGAYSIDPKNPLKRIQEFKELINEIHKKDMGVILDVVYTHMYKTDFLDDIVPGYYFFKDQNGKYVGSFGNNLATTNFMVKKLILDSIKYWISEFKIDGFRFDMMGDIDRDTVEEAYLEAKKLNPNIVFLGEGWRTFSAYNYGVKGADQDWLEQIDNISMFSDEFRNLIKSGYGSEGEPRFISNGEVDIKTLFKSIIGLPTNTKADKPSDSVQYIESHDNMTLTDVIAVAINKKPLESLDEIHKRIRLANTLLFTSQGLAFLHAGQEFGLSKEWREINNPEDKFIKTQIGTFITDSYNASDAINNFDWTLMQKQPYKKTLELTTALIDLRKKTDAFRLKDRDLVEKNVTLLSDKIRDIFIAYSTQSTDGELFYILVNGDLKDRYIIIDQDIEKLIVIFDSNNYNYQGLDSFVNLSLENIEKNTKVLLSPLSSIILKVKK